jgi:hypothetical protein
MARRRHIHRLYHKPLLWGIWLAFILGASIALINYAGQVGVYSGNYGLPSCTWLTQQAARQAEQNLWMLGMLGAIAVVLTMTLVTAPGDVSSVAGKLKRFLVAGW